MKETLLIEIPGKPFGKQRPRFSRNTGRAYTPDETIRYENLIKALFVQKYPGFIPRETPVKMTIGATFPIPKSWPKKKQIQAIEGKIKPSKPDWDNCGKVVSDGLQNIAFLNDSQVYECTVYKQYGERPGVLVLIEFDERGEE